MPEHEQPGEELDPPPILGRWQNVYLAVSLYLFIVVALLYWITRAFTY